MNQKEIYLSFVLFATAFVVLLVTLNPYRRLSTETPPLPIPTPATIPPYICPASEWVDCMPGPDADVKFKCTPEALSWFKLNCPNFKGAAL